MWLEVRATDPPNYNVAIIDMYFLLAVAGGIAGFFWAEIELKRAEAKKSTAAIIQRELSQARARLEVSVENLKKASDDALEQSVYGGNPREI